MYGRKQRIYVWNLDELHETKWFQKYYAVYSVVARESVGTQQILFEFLERIREDFKKIYGQGKGDAAKANSLTKKFGYAFFQP